MIRLIASDLDGTIIGNNNSISETNMQVINNLQKKNIPLVICTGKTYAISKDICKNLHANFGIFGNGSQIINLSTGDEILKKTISFDEINSCFSTIQNYGLHIHAYTEDSIITSNLLYMDLRNSILFPDKIKIEIVDSVLDYIKDHNSSILKLVISSPTSLTTVKDSLEKTTNLTINHISKTGIYKDIIIDKEYEYLDISPSNITKGSALQILSNYLNLKKEDILSIGDNINDIDMFKASNISAALNNGFDNFLP
ncbi:MAG: HAD-IIB family hydrolase [Clostridia bacterium]|nr:HAD-IIB family hydrolase [Clostridia bacterium]